MSLAALKPTVKSYLLLKVFWPRQISKKNTFFTFFSVKIHALFALKWKLVKHGNLPLLQTFFETKNVWSRFDVTGSYPSKKIKVLLKPNILKILLVFFFKVIAITEEGEIQCFFALKSREKGMEMGLERRGSFPSVIEEDTSSIILPNMPLFEQLHSKKTIFYFK